MAYVITDECVACGTCAEACPAEAISEGDGKYVIDADACLDCGTCEGECPTGAIVAGDVIPANVNCSIKGFGYAISLGKTINTSSTHS